MTTSTAMKKIILIALKLIPMIAVIMNIAIIQINKKLKIVKIITMILNHLIITVAQIMIMNITMIMHMHMNMTIVIITTIMTILTIVTIMTIKALSMDVLMITMKNTLMITKMIIHTMAILMEKKKGITKILQVCFYTFSLTLWEV